MDRMTAGGMDNNTDNDSQLSQYTCRKRATRHSYSTHARTYMHTYVLMYACIVCMRSVCMCAMYGSMHLHVTCDDQHVLPRTINILQ